MEELKRMQDWCNERKHVLRSEGKYMVCNICKIGFKKKGILTNIVEKFKKR
jgi:hypothetical protein